MTTTSDLAAFMARFAPDELAKRVQVISAAPLEIDGEEHSPLYMIVTEHGTLILNPFVLRGGKPHLCVDVHAFDADGKAARTGVFGMEEGRRWRLGGSNKAGDTHLATPGTSHGWPATKLVALLLGEQKEEE